MKKQRKKLLVVDDSLQLVDLIDFQARMLDYDCYVELNGSDCIEKALALLPDLILMDMDLPAISGLGLVRELKGHSKLKEIPIVAFSGLSDLEVRVEAYDLGVAAYLIKGQETDKLFEIIAKHIKH